MGIDRLLGTHNQLYEHKPSAGLSLVPPIDADQVRSFLGKSHFWEDENLPNIIAGILARLAFFDTQTTIYTDPKPGETIGRRKDNMVGGSDFERAYLFLEEIFGIHEADSEVGIQYFPGTINPQRKGAIIYPKDLEEIIERVDSVYFADDEVEPIDLYRPVIHFHLDTVSVNNQKGSLATLETHIDKETGLIYTRGANDMKGQTALAAVVMEMCKQNNLPLPVFLITTDEEKAGKNGGTKLANSVKGNVFIDWEPVAGLAGCFVNEVEPVLGVGLGTSRQLDLKAMKQIQLTIGQFYSSDPIASCNDHEVFVSVNPSNFNEPSRATMGTLLAILRKYAKGVEDPGICYYIDNEKKRTSYLKKPLLSIVAQALKNHYPLQKSDRQITRGSNTKLLGGVFGRRFRRGAFTGNINTIGFFNKESISNYLVMGVDEAGGGRHSSTEAVYLHQLVQLLFTTYKIIELLKAEDQI
ncbi:MAG: M20/M25/M40 family metallo-hydrolase [Candidatus Dojkabacteria bacterium]|uniref:M20/M25/M40 family metallo-hydrolase n=1 Tax=Candidatus Dojkabacteria bacterium TaxID=2099670 RepID=A0A952AGN8_9BACT|nr:M20/M25/M40 family metallo-hydrolase [Candidatus Dojkabacteria bacterium]WKZ27848.1 MAG: M20/M25/M40 family metallo-hydrolase [Candidatus Dojkabacteria bacterium]